MPLRPTPYPPPSTSADSVSLAPDRYTIDALLVDKFIGYSAELLRLSLLLLGGVGWVLAPGTVAACIVQDRPAAAGCFAVGTVATIVAAACALAHRYVATDAVAEHIFVLRHDVLATRCSEADRAKEMDKVRHGRIRRNDKLKSCGRLLVASAACLVAGVLFAAAGAAVSLLAPQPVECTSKEAQLTPGAG